MKNILIVYMLLFAGFANGQQVYIQTQKSYYSDIFSKNYYSVDRIMEMREELDLTDAQAAKIKKIHSENAAEFNTLKWDLDKENKKLRTILDEPKVDQLAMKKQMDEVLKLENQLKKKQLITMTSIKNVMSESQQKILDKPTVLTLTKSESGTTSSHSVTGLTSTKESGSKSSSVSVVVAGKDQPIYYLDTKEGYKLLEDLKSINPNDIERIDVLKDKSAVDKFGEKGKNGVIIITLKVDSKK